MAVPDDKLNELAANLGVTVDSLNLLDIGYMGFNKWSFPMYDGQRKPTGIRTRTLDGQKRAVTGTKEGLFIPFKCRDGIVVFTEGPTDCAAILDLGFYAVGRPSCNGGEEFALQLVGRRKVAVLADNDESSVGARGALRFAQAIRRKASEVKVLHLAYRKDAREFVRNGGTREAIETIYACMNAL